MRHDYDAHGQQSQWTVSDQTRSLSPRGSDRTMKRPAFQSKTGLNPLAKHYTLCQYTPLRPKLEAGYLTLTASVCGMRWWRQSMKWAEHMPMQMACKLMQGGETRKVRAANDPGAQGSHYQPSVNSVTQLGTVHTSGARNRGSSCDL